MAKVLLNEVRNEWVTVSHVKAGLEVFVTGRLVVEIETCMLMIATGSYIRFMQPNIQSIEKGANGKTTITLHA
jgi:hypothetical protein